MTSQISTLVESLQLQPHPEGGFFREIYRSQTMVQTVYGPRAAATAIYFLLAEGYFSAFHRIVSDEGWHFYSGAPVTIHWISPTGDYGQIGLGNNPGAGQCFQAMVPGGYWFASESIGQPGFSLVGCTVAPGFDFADFELADRNQLSAAFPQHAALIKRLTR